MNLMFCTKCGTENQSNMKYCKNCGAALPQNVSVPISQPTPVKKKSKGPLIGISAVLAITCVGAAAWLFLAGPFQKNTAKNNKAEEKQTIQKSQKEKDTKKQEQTDQSTPTNDSKSIDANQKKNRQILLEFIETNLKQGKKDFQGNPRYYFADHVILPRDSQYRFNQEDSSYLFGYQLIDVNFDGIEELLLHFASDVQNYTIICNITDNGEVQINPEILSDNQNASPLEYASALAIYENKSTNDKLSIISGADGSGAENLLFVTEIQPDFTTNIKFSYISGIGTEPDSHYRIDEKEVSEEAYQKEFQKFQNNYSCIETYHYQPIIRDLAEEFAVFAGLEEEPEVTEAEWKEAYKNFLENYSKNQKQSSSSSDSHYQLIDLDGDSIPELLIADGDYHAEGVHIYTYTSKTVYHIGAYGSYGMLSYRKKDGLVESFYSGQGHEYTTYFKIKNGVEQVVAKFQMLMQENGNDIDPIYYYNEKQVSKAEYDKQQKAITENQKLTTISYADMDSITKVKSTLEPTEKTNEPSAQPTEDSNLYTGTIPLTISAVETSSILADQYGNNYDGTNLIDNNLATAWAEGAQNTGIGEWIRIHLQQEEVVSTIGILNGYGKSQELYKKNARLKSALLTFSDGSTQQIFLDDDTVSVQKIKINPVKTSSIQITIQEVYDGTQYTDLCISEIACYQ